MASDTAKGGFFRRFFVGALVGVAAWYLLKQGYAFVRKASVSGSVFVSTRGGQTFKMSGIKVYAINEDRLRQSLATLKSKISADELNKTPVEEQVAALTQLLQGFRSTYTDADGKFEMNGLPAGHYVVLAGGNRVLPDNTAESYLWMRTGDFRNGQEYEGVLQNTYEVIGQMGLREKFSGVSGVDATDLFNMAFLNVMRNYGW